MLPRCVEHYDELQPLDNMMLALMTRSTRESMLLIERVFGLGSQASVFSAVMFELLIRTGDQLGSDAMSAADMRALLLCHAAEEVLEFAPQV
jgi:hypothetical protein